MKPLREINPQHITVFRHSATSSLNSEDGKPFNIFPHSNPALKHVHKPMKVKPIP